MRRIPVDPSATVHNHGITNQNSWMKISRNTTVIQSTPFIIFRMITECVAGRCMVGSVVHSVPTMYIYASCLWVIHTAVAIRWPGTASGKIFGTPLFSHWKKLKGKKENFKATLSVTEKSPIGLLNKVLYGSEALPGGHTPYPFIYQFRQKRCPICISYILSLFRAENNGQQVAGHDDRPNIF